MKKDKANRQALREAALQRVRQGEAVRAVARALSLPEATLRGWAKQEKTPTKVPACDAAAVAPAATPPPAAGLAAIGGQALQGAETAAVLLRERVCEALDSRRRCAQITAQLIAGDAEEEEAEALLRELRLLSTMSDAQLNATLRNLVGLARSVQPETPPTLQVEMGPEWEEYAE